MHLCVDTFLYYEYFGHPLYSDLINDWKVKGF